ncbi:MAG: hypothetical protein A2Y14_03920 [Verrucomicrobia bacterium GWF2_51_19]|nr:MAG: hypothetical protein A2Y14_03920 [Verrucomicrobia bacterium GWF2_51_19]HCJ11693.1 hypothetical protein [Opitutae bacterium]
MQKTLVIDSSLGTTQVGLGFGMEGDCLTSETPTLESLFQLIDSLLQTHALSLDRLGAIVYCEGPGSTLGIRIACMAIRTWKMLFPTLKIYSYRNLECAWEAMGQPNATLYSPHNQNTLNRLQKIDGRFAWSVIEKATLAVNDSAYFVGPRNDLFSQYCPYSLQALMPFLQDSLMTEKQLCDIDAFVPLLS